MQVGFITDAMHIRRGSLEEQVRYGIRASLLTRRGERRNDPELGSQLHDFLFRPMAASTLTEMRSDIRRSIEYGEPRAVIHEVEIETDAIDRGAIHLKLGYEIKETNRMGQMRISVQP